MPDAPQITLERETLARVICDGFSNGNEQFDEASVSQQERCLSAADSLLAHFASICHNDAPSEATDDMLKAAFNAMNQTSSGTWKRMKAAGQTPREMFDAKMRPRYAAMIAAHRARQQEGGHE